MGEVDLGFRFLKAYWNQGLATESAVACLDFGFEVLGLPEIVAYVMPENGASIRVLEKIGMRSTGPIVYDGLDVIRYVKRSAA